MPKKSMTWWDMARSGGSSAIGMLKMLPTSVANSKKIAVLELTPRAHRSQDEHDEEKANQDGKKAGREREVVHLAVHRPSYQTWSRRYPRHPQSPSSGPFRRSHCR
jgi:hypothetical protein